MTKAPFFPLATLLAGTLACPVQGADWPQFHGPNHDGISREKILTLWPTNGLRQVWKVPMTDGFSGITVADGKAFTMMTREVDGRYQEVCVALNADTGNELWATPLGRAQYDDASDPNSSNAGTPDNKGGAGPRSTPSYDSGKVYTYSVLMVLKCMDAETGRQIWDCDITKEHAGRRINYQCAASPLVVGNLVYVEGGGPGEGLLAFDKNDGHVVWKGQNDKMTHSTPVPATILGQPQIIFWTQTGLVAVKPDSGEVLWRYPTLIGTYVMFAVSPVVSGDLMYVSGWYAIGSRAFQISKTPAEGGSGAHTDANTATNSATNFPYQARQLYRLWGPARDMANDWCTPVCTNGYLYGIYGHAMFGRAPLMCVELATGKIMWRHPGFGPGGCMLVNGEVLVLSDAGDLVLVKADPTAYSETARCHVLAGKCWNCPSISNGRIYARSTKEGVCLDVSIK